MSEYIAIVRDESAPSQWLRVKAKDDLWAWVAARDIASDLGYDVRQVYAVREVPAPARSRTW